MCLVDGLIELERGEVGEDDHEKNLSVFNITKHEGKNRQIRRMCDYIGYPVRQLKRYKIANLTLTSLKKGQYRQLFEEELTALFKAVGSHE